MTLLLLLTATAWPCEVQCPEVPYRFAAFPDDAAPLNTRLLVGWRASGEPEPVVTLEVLDTDAELPGVLSAVEAERETAWFFTPDAPLPPLTELVLTLDGLGDLITTGEAADTTPPTGGGLLHAEAHQTHRRGPGACPAGVQRSLTLEMDPAGDVGSLALYELELTREDDAVEGFVFSRPVDWLGQGECRDNLAWTPGERLRLRSRAVDYAANAGDWSEPLELRTPRCQPVPGPAGLTLGLAALAFARRRR